MLKEGRVDAFPFPLIPSSYCTRPSLLKFPELFTLNCPFSFQRKHNCASFLREWGGSKGWLCTWEVDEDKQFHEVLWSRDGGSDSQALLHILVVSSRGLVPEPLKLSRAENRAHYKSDNTFDWGNVEQQLAYKLQGASISKAHRRCPGGIPGLSPSF